MVGRGTVSYRKTSRTVARKHFGLQIEPPILSQPISEKLETVDSLM